MGSSSSRYKSEFYDSVCHKYNLLTERSSSNATKTNPVESFIDDLYGLNDKAEWERLSKLREELISEIQNLKEQTTEYNQLITRQKEAQETIQVAEQLKPQLSKFESMINQKLYRRVRKIHRGAVNKSPTSEIEKHVKAGWIVVSIDGETDINLVQGVREICAKSWISYLVVDYLAPSEKIKIDNKSHYQSLKNRIKVLEKEIELLRTQIHYQPLSEGYREAEEDFVSLQQSLVLYETV